MNPSRTRTRPARRPWQFGLRSLLLVMVLASFVSALLGLSQRAVGISQPLFVVLCMAAPLGVIVLIGAVQAVAKIASHRKRPSGQDGDDEGADASDYPKPPVW